VMGTPLALVELANLVTSTVKFPSVEPTTHRMRWIQLNEKEWGLVVVPLHGRGNKNGEGAPVKVLLYHPPTSLNDPKGELHMGFMAQDVVKSHPEAVTKVGGIMAVNYELASA